jgi:hypothetical protein
VGRSSRPIGLSRGWPSSCLLHAFYERR